MANGWANETILDVKVVTDGKGEKERPCTVKYKDDWSSRLHI